MASAGESANCSSEESFQLECSPCGLDGSVKEAKYFCTDCQEYLCQPCEAQHKRFKGTRDHAVSVCAEIKSQDDDTDAVTCSCKRKDVEIYCENHNEIVCSDCKTINHRLCKTKSIDIVISEQEADFDVKTLDITDQVKSELKKLATDRKQSLDQLNADTDQVQEEIVSFGNKLKNRIDVIQENTLKDLKTVSSRHSDVVEHHLTACETALTALSFDYNEHMKANETENKRKKFLTHLKLTQTLGNINVLKEEIKKEIYEPSLLFDSNEELSSVLGFDSLGTVKHDLFSRPRSFNADMTVQASRKVTVKLSSDQSDAWISGSLFLPSGELILCDKNNTCLKRFDAEFISPTCYQLPKWPRDCCLTKKDEILVTFPELKQIQHLNTSPNITLKNTINFDAQCECVDSLNDDIFVTCSDFQKMKEIRIIDTDGNTKRKLTLQEDTSGDFLRPYYITISAFGIFISESNYFANKTQIRCFDSCGLCRFKLARQDLDGIGGLIVDVEGRLLACFSKSNTIQVISKDGTKCHKFFDSKYESKMNGPYSICFRRTDRTLVIAQRDNNQMFIFKLI